MDSVISWGIACLGGLSGLVYFFHIVLANVPAQKDMGSMSTYINIGR